MINLIQTFYKTMCNTYLHIFVKLISESIL